MYTEEQITDAVARALRDHPGTDAVVFSSDDWALLGELDIIKIGLGGIGHVAATAHREIRAYRHSFVKSGTVAAWATAGTWNQSRARQCVPIIPPPPPDPPLAFARDEALYGVFDEEVGF